MIGYIYKIINKINNKFYIGSTVNLKNRKNAHFSNLKNNKHPNKHLQNSWNIYKENNFEFKVFKKLEVDNRRELYEEEQKYLDSVPKEYVYNKTFLALGAGADKLKKSCFVLNSKGDIIHKFDSRKEAAVYLGKSSGSDFNRILKKYKCNVKSKKDNKKYKVLDCNYFLDNIEEINNYFKNKNKKVVKKPKNKVKKYYHRGEYLTLSEAAREDGVTKQAIEYRLKTYGKTNPGRKRKLKNN